MNWSYISGFFDADGSVSLTRQHSSQQRNVQLSFHNNYLNILTAIESHILKELEVRGTITKKTAKKENHNDSYELKYNYFPKVLKICKHLKPIHPVKKARINILPELYNLTPRNGKYTPKMLQQREILIQQFFAF